MDIFKRYQRVIFFDTETTGLNPMMGDQIIELAAICVDKEGSVKEMDEFIKLFAMDELPKKITELTGITDLDLACNGIEEEAALAQFFKMVGATGSETLLVAHNAQFDLMFLKEAVKRACKHDGGQRLIELLGRCDYLDTLTVYKDRRPYPHRLANAIDAYNLSEKVQNSHRAVDDCKALYEVSKAMQAERDDLDEYVNVFGYNAKYGISGNRLEKVTYLEQGFRYGMATPDQILPNMKERA